MAIGRSHIGDHPDRLVCDLHLGASMRPAEAAKTQLSDVALATEYREHAQALRRLASEERPAWANDALMKAADDYDRMANSVERTSSGPGRRARTH